MLRHARKLGFLLTGLGLVTLLGATACDKGGEEAAAKDGDAKASAEAGSGGAPTTTAEAKTFLKDQSKKGCEMLPPALVAKTFEVPEAELQQMKIAGCIYSYDSGDGSQTVEASINTIFVRDDPAKARQHFDNATKNMTAEEIKAQMGMVMGKAKESEAIDTAAKDKGVDQVGGMMAAMVPDGGYQYEDVPGVGDAARVLTHDGKLTVLVGNMVFTVGAYKGPAAPAPDLTGVSMQDMDAVMAAAKKADAEWMAKTRDVRREQAATLAKAIVAGL